MKKIIAAFDGLKYSNSTRDYAIDMAKQANAHLVGVFLEDVTYTSYKIYDLVSAKGGLIGSAKKQLDRKDAKARAAAVANFEAACRKAGIEHTMHRDRRIAIQELLHESIYADLLVIEARETLTHYTEKPPTRFIRDVLANVQCPVLVVPRVYKPVGKLVLLYDGEPSSVYAIKMASYTLALPATVPVDVLSVNTPERTMHMPDNTLMKEFMKRHFPTAAFTVIKGLPETEILNYLREQKDNTLVVLGAYRRSVVSRWFRHSMADVLLQSLKLPLFIAHNKS